MPTDSETTEDEAAEPQMETKDGGRGDPDETSQRVPAGNYTLFTNIIVTFHSSHIQPTSHRLFDSQWTHTFFIYCIFNLTWQVIINTNPYLQCLAWQAASGNGKMYNKFTTVKITKYRQIYIVSQKNRQKKAA